MNRIDLNLSFAIKAGNEFKPGHPTRPHAIEYFNKRLMAGRVVCFKNDLICGTIFRIIVSDRHKAKSLKKSVNRRLETFKLCCLV